MHDMTHKVYICICCIAFLFYCSSQAEFTVCPDSPNLIDPNNVWLEQPKCTYNSCILDLNQTTDEHGYPEISAHWNLTISDQVLRKPYFWFMVTLSLNGKNYTGKELFIKSEDENDLDQENNENAPATITYVDILVESNLIYFIIPGGNGILYLEILLGDPDILNTVYYRYCVYRYVTVLPFNNLNFEDKE